MSGPLRRLSANLGGMARAGALRAALPGQLGTWLRVRLAKPLLELPAPASLGARSAALGLTDVLACLERAAGDPRIDGVYVELAGGGARLAAALPLARALAAVEAAGKPVVAWGESVSAEELVIASAARHFHLAPAGSVALVGLRIESFFLRDLLERLGARPEVVRIGSFKSAGEMFTRASMSPEHREQLEALLDDRFSALLEAIAAGRDLAPERLRELVDGGPYPARAAVEAGLADGLLHRDELRAELERLAPARPGAGPRHRELRLLDVGAYHQLRIAWPGWRPLRGDLARIALVVAQGAIRHGGGLRGVASEPYGRLLSALAGDPGVRAVVLRVESPGGDAVASDALWRAVSQLRREKPVVASFGEVAASGGYYLASAADRVFAERASVTGSIGVVGGKLDLSRLYERIGVAKESIERGARAGLASEARALRADERAALRASMRALYDLFLERVASGRGLARDAVAAVAGGRIWSGSAALGHGLVDAIGGPLEALAEARRLGGVLDEEPHLLESHPRIPRLAALRSLIGFGVGTR